jgi:ribonucleoside-diphosphate reductase alpha chain
MGHIKMMSATQPFLSGAISKTVNLPQDASVEDIAEAYIESWRQGLKAVAIYRDNSKGSQPLNVSASDGKAQKEKDAVSDRTSDPASNKGVILSEGAAAVEGSAVLAAAEAKLHAQALQISTLEQQIKTIAEAASKNADAIDAQSPPRAVRHRLPAERASITHKFGLSGHEGYITVGLYPNGQPGEIFIRMAKEGSTVSGLMDSFATAISLALQHGVPLRVLCEKFAHTRFEPSGWTGNEQIGYAKSIMDYLFRWMQIRFLSGQQLSLFAGLAPQTSVPVEGHIGSLTGSASYEAEKGGVLSTDREDQKRGVILSGGAAGVEGSAVDFYSGTTPPREGIAPDPTYTSSVSSRPEQSGVEGSASPLTMEDRGIYHAADAMKSMYDMGDAPSCATCGAIMTRNGSCYRCMECGSTSGCS